MYYYFYKIVNNINLHYYYGIHKTDNLNDGYMGSGKRLHIAYKKYGRENFSKYILKFFENEIDMCNYEFQIVNPITIVDPNCYNICIGGNYRTYGCTICIDINNNIFICSLLDPRYISGEIVNINTHTKLPSKQKIVDLTTYYKKPFFVNFDLDYIKLYVNNDNYQILHRHDIRVLDINGNLLWVNNKDPRIFSGELKKAPLLKNEFKFSDELKLKLKNSMKDKQKGEKNSLFGTHIMYKDNLALRVYHKDITQYLNNGWDFNKNKDADVIKKYDITTNSITYERQYIHVFKNKETKRILFVDLNSYILDGWKKGIYNEISRKGSRNPSYGKIYIYKNNESIKINPEELEFYIQNGWKKGRVLNKIWMHYFENDNKISKLVNKEDIEKYLLNNWIKGR